MHYKKKYEDSDDEIDLLNSQIQKIERNDCIENGHRVLLCLGIDRDEYEGRSYYECICLNCGSKTEIPKGNMEAYRIIDGRNYVKESNILVLDIIDQAKDKYHLLKDCYYKYPEILKEEEKQDKIIYKAMRKRYETSK